CARVGDYGYYEGDLDFW
nr:immunoglobulin heavy chain junction region [Macaca mulatta]